MNLNYDILLSHASRCLSDFEGCEEAKWVDYQDKQIVVIRDQALILFNSLEKVRCTLGWSLNHKTVVAVHRHNGGDPNLLYAGCEQITGIAKPLFSFTTASAAAERVDVMKLHPYFPSQWESQIFDEIGHEYLSGSDVKFYSWLKTLIPALSERKIGIQKPLFVFDYVSQKFYLLPTSLGPNPSGNEDFLKRHYKNEASLPNTLHRPYEPHEWGKFTPRSFDKGQLRIGDQIMRGAFKKIYKGVLQQGEQVHHVAVSVINLLSQHYAPCMALEEEGADRLQGKPGIVPIWFTIKHEMGLRFEVVMPLFECDLQQASDLGLLTLEEKVHLCRDAAIGVKAYHEEIGIYCDLKPDNILLNPSSKPISGRLTDFSGGLKRGSSSLGHCSVLYASPQMLELHLHKPGTVLTDKHDSWSMGAMMLNVFYFMVLDQSVLDRIENVKIAAEERLALIKEWIPRIPEMINNVPPGSIKEVLRKLLYLDPEARLSMDEFIAELPAILEEMRNNERV
jgi:hypothetical protein